MGPILRKGPRRSAKYAKDFNAKVHILTSLIGEQVLPEATTWRVIGKEADTVQEAASYLEAAQKTLADEGISCEKHLLIRGLEQEKILCNSLKR